MGAVRRRLRRPHVTRDVVLFVSGLCGIAYETLAQAAERPTLLLLFAAMIGLPAFLRSDESKSQGTPPDADENKRVR